MQIYFNDSQYVIVDINPRFYEFYGTEHSGYFVPITRQDNLQRGLFGIIMLPADDVEANFRHEAGHAAFAWVRVHGYAESEEESILVIQDELMDGFKREYER